MATSTTFLPIGGRTSRRCRSRLAEAAGLKVRRACYFDLLGVPPYYLVYKLLRQTEISGSTMWGYDWVVVPASRLLQRVLVRPPAGKNVVLVATRPATPSP